MFLLMWARFCRVGPVAMHWTDRGQTVDSRGAGQSFPQGLLSFKCKNIPKLGSICVDSGGPVYPTHAPRCWLEIGGPKSKFEPHRRPQAEVPVTDSTGGWLDPAEGPVLRRRVVEPQSSLPLLCCGRALSPWCPSAQEPVLRCRVAAEPQSSLPLLCGRALPNPRCQN
jgi:hypothetical protein